MASFPPAPRATQLAARLQQLVLRRNQQAAHAETAQLQLLRALCTALRGAAAGRPLACRWSRTRAPAGLQELRAPAAREHHGGSTPADSGRRRRWWDVERSTPTGAWRRPQPWHTPRAHYCSSAAAAADQAHREEQRAGGPASTSRARLVFFGSPAFAALVLRDLCGAARAPDAQFEVAAVVSRPLGPAQSAPHQAPGIPAQPAHVTPVICEALRQGLTPHQLLCPATAKEAWFLDALEALRPDLCVTAAYGCILPQRLLDAPRLGTVNVHPSLLPKYRGAAPVQRCLEDGCAETGMSLVMTVLRCDAGPVVAQRRVRVAPDEQAPELTRRLFTLGSRMLLEHLPALLSGEAQRRAAPQDEAAATHARKLATQERHMDFGLTAHKLHDKVRAFAGWPGTRASFLVESLAEEGRSGLDAGAAPRQQPQRLELKVLRTRVVTHASQLRPQHTQHAQQQHSELSPPPAAASDHDDASCSDGAVGAQQPSDGASARGGSEDGAQARQAFPPGELPGLGRPLPTAHASCVSGHMLVPCAGGTSWLELCAVRHAARGSSREALTGAELMAGLSGRRVLRVDMSGHG